MPSSELAPVTTAALPLSSNSRLLSSITLLARHLRRLGKDLLRQARDRTNNRLDVFAGARIDLELALARLFEEFGISHGRIVGTPQGCHAIRRHIGRREPGAPGFEARSMEGEDLALLVGPGVLKDRRHLVVVFRHAILFGREQ